MFKPFTASSYFILICWWTFYTINIMYNLGKTWGLNAINRMRLIFHRFGIGATNLTHKHNIFFPHYLIVKYLDQTNNNTHTHTQILSRYIIKQTPSLRPQIYSRFNCGKLLRTLKLSMMGFGKWKYDGCLCVCMCMCNMWLVLDLEAQQTHTCTYPLKLRRYDTAETIVERKFTLNL